MLATRGNDENVIHSQQAAAAAKSLGEGVKGAPTTTAANIAGAIAPKTPFKVAQHDENARGGTGGKGVKGGKDGQLGEMGGKGGKGEREPTAFVTPAGPKNRAPLGHKTTNAKAIAFRTPAPPKTKATSPVKPSSTKPTSPRLRRARFQIHQPTLATAQSLRDDNEEPEIEYMPPHPTPLPDYPDDDWPPDRTYPQFQGANLTKGWWSEFHMNRDETEEEAGVREQREFREKLMMAEARERKQMEELREREAKAAAALLKAGSGDAVNEPRFTAPTASAKARQLSARAGKKTEAFGNARHAAAKAASKTTVGYSKGRAVSSSTRPPLSSRPPNPSALQQVIVEDNSSQTAPPPHRHRTTLDDLFEGQNGSNLRVDGETGGLFGPTAGMMEVLEDAFDGFQLDPVQN